MVREERERGREGQREREGGGGDEGRRENGCVYRGKQVRIKKMKEKHKKGTDPTKHTHTILFVQQVFSNSILPTSRQTRKRVGNTFS